jgi:hypothetical protein
MDNSNISAFNILTYISANSNMIALIIPILAVFIGGIATFSLQEIQNVLNRWKWIDFLCKNKLIDDYLKEYENITNFLEPNPLGLKNDFE